MKIIRLFFPLILVCSGVFLLIYSIIFYKNDVQRVLNQDIKINLKKDFVSLSSGESIFIKQVLENYIRSNNLPIEVQQGNEGFILFSNKKEILINKEEYEKFLSFLDFISSFPYKIEYSNLCLGINCGERVVSFTVIPKKEKEVYVK